MTSSFLSEFTPYEVLDEEFEKLKKATIIQPPKRFRKHDLGKPPDVFTMKDSIPVKPLRWCIYYIRFAYQSKKYIGSTTRWPLRVNCHRHNLKAQCHCNSYLQHAFNKYGKRGVSFSVIEYIDPSCGKNFLLQRESFWIKVYRSADPRYGYNIHKTPLKRGSGHMSHKRFKIYNPQGELITIDNLVEFCKEKGLDYQKMHKTISGHIINYQGWRGDLDRKDLIKKEYRFRSPNGKTYEGVGIRKFSLSHGLNPSRMSNVSLGKIRHHQGWSCPDFTFEPSRVTKTYRLIHKNGQEITVTNLAKWCRDNFDQNACQRLHKGRFAGEWKIKEHCA